MKKQEISFVNTVLCLLVMWIHICSVVIGSPEQYGFSYFVVFLSWRLSAFVVQGFLFLSALKFFRKMKPDFSYGHFMKSRIRKIGIPYVIATVVSYFGLIFLHYYTFDFRFLLRSLLLGDMIAPFYFVIILFQFYLLMPLWRKMVEKVDFWLAAVVSVLLMRLFHEGLPTMLALCFPEFSFAYNDRVFSSYLAYWVLGCYAGRYYDCFLAGLQKNGKYILFGFAIFLFADGLLAYGNTTGKFSVPFLEDVHTLYVCFALLAVFWIGKNWSEGFFRFRFLQGINGMSFYIYLYHGIWLYFVQDKLLALLQVKALYQLCLRAVLCLGGAFALGSIWIWYQKRKKV